jgi:hypothetical protein
VHGKSRVKGGVFLWPVTDAGVGRRRRRAEWKESENSAAGKGWIGT